MISIVQNFICTDDKRLDYLKNDLPGIANLFKGYPFYVNYNTNENWEEIYKLYNSNIDKLNLYNNLTPDWSKVTLSLVKKVKTEYVLLMCEDYKAIADKEYLDNCLNEAFVENNCEFMMLHRIKKYAKDSLFKSYQKKQYTYISPAEEFPIQTCSSIAIYKKDLLIDLLKEHIINDRGDNLKHRFPISTPNNYEWYYHNRFTELGERDCAIPQDWIIKHHEPEQVSKIGTNY